MNLIESLDNMESIVEYIEKNCVSDIVLEMVTRFDVNMTELLRWPMGGYNKDKSSGSYFYCVKDLKENLDTYKWMFDNLSDDKSKSTFLNLLRYRLTTSVNFINDAYDCNYDQYFDKEIVGCLEDEVYVDCGSFTGDTIESYIKNFKTYKKIYGYEPEDENYEKCMNRISGFNNIQVNKCGISNKSDRVYYHVDGGASYISKEPTEKFIDVVSLDEDITERVSFIKMDIEGEEINGILGCKNHIKNETPKLAISLYHIVSDLWEIPKLIHSINSNYKFYLRHYRYDVAWETILYAIPCK